jgi:hypothetical protein
LWNCEGTPPANIIASATYANAGNAQIAAFCAYVYESTAFPGEHYARVSFTNGNNPTGPVHPNSAGTTGYCAHDTSARRHMWFSNLDDGPCPVVRYSYPDLVNNQKLSNGCRKAIKNIAGFSAGQTITPPIQYFAGSREEALGKLAVLDTVELGCLGIDNIATGNPYRVEEEFYAQASAELTLTGN